MKLTLVDLTPLDRLRARFARIADPDATPLMLTWMRIIADDNRRGVLAGLDKDDKPLLPVTYRPKPPTSTLTKGQRNGARANARAGPFAGLGVHSAGINNNLSKAEYRRLDGPPLAPRRQFSRVITNLVTGYDPGNRGNGLWVAYGGWDQVVSRGGFSFLPVHFNGEPLGRNGPKKRRDLRGVRAWGRERAKSAAREWMIDMVRSSGV